MKNNLLWITGGAFSGKTRLAEHVASCFESVAYFGTARAQQPGDELALLTAQLKQARPKHWKQFDAPFTFEDLKQTAQTTQCLVFDCLTMWLAWSLTDAHHKYAPEHLRSHVMREWEYLLEVLEKLPCAVVLVSNEVGSGVVPSQPSARWFREIAGRANLAAHDHAGYFVHVVAGRALLLAHQNPSATPQPVMQVSAQWLAEQLSGR